MKAFFTANRLRRSRALPFCSALAIALIACSAQATDDFFINTGPITSAPQVDAFNFVNSGSISLSTSLPFETSNTRNYTNSGTMTGSPGFFFDDAAPNNGPRFPADNFVNLNGGTVQAQDTATVLGGGIIVGVGIASTPVSYLWVSASNVINQGTLSVGGGGWLKIIGTNVGLARSAIEVTALQPQGSRNIGTNYINDVGISDVWWGQTNATWNSSGIYNGTRANAPAHQVQQGPGAPPSFVSFGFNSPIASGYTNISDFIQVALTNSDGSTTNITIATNIFRQAAFVGVGNTNIMSAAVSFAQEGFTPLRTICVRLSMQSTNVITGQTDQNNLFFYDTLASLTNRGLLINLNSPALPPFVDQKPANYLLSRIDDGRFATGSAGNVVPDRTFIYDPQTFTNAFVSGDYAGYNALVDNLAAEPPPIGPGTVTNLPGRVQVTGDTVDLRATRVRGEGEVVVKANHLLSSAGAAVDCQNLSYNLGSTNGNLDVVNLSKLSVLRLKGNLLAWSGFWSNQLNLIFTNNFTVTNVLDTNGMVIGTNSVPSPLTNTVFLAIHALVLDGVNLASQVPVITWDFITHSLNTVLSDSISVVQSLFIDGQSFTVNGALNLTSTTVQNTRGQSATTAINDFTHTNAPSLLYLTNNGTFTGRGEFHFGDDRAVPYVDFVNAGFLEAGSLSVASTYIENDSTLFASVGPLALSGNTGKFQGGSTTSSGDINSSFGDAKFFTSTLTAVGTINFSVTNALSDAGPNSTNTFSAQNGINLLIKPNTGDLIGTTVQSRPPNFVQVNHVWAGQDRGNSASGYLNNVALGKLVLTTPTTNATSAPLFFFKGANGHNGLYVDLLDLTTMASEYIHILSIDPSITIYYAAAKIGYTPPPNPAGIPQEPEEFLNGQFGGHLVWVSSFAGPNSSTTVLVNGQPVVMNTALRNSKIIDSDGDGIPNFFDSTPLGGNGGGTPPPSGLTLGSGLFNRPSSSEEVFSLNWNASANTTYRVEMTTDLANPNWQLVTTYTNTSPTTANVIISDTNSVSTHQRFYRVRIVP
jgi:hypothetical protein